MQKLHKRASLRLRPRFGGRLGVRQPSSAIRRGGVAAVSDTPWSEEISCLVLRLLVARSLSTRRPEAGSMSYKNASKCPTSAKFMKRYLALCEDQAWKCSEPSAPFEFRRSHKKRWSECLAPRRERRQLDRHAQRPVADHPAATAFASVTPELEIANRVVARAHLETGVPVVVHCYATGRQIAILQEQGVDLERAKADHSNNTTDIEHLQWILDQGCFPELDSRLGQLARPRIRTATPRMRTATRMSLIDDDCRHMRRHRSPNVKAMGAGDDVIKTLLAHNAQRSLEGR